MSLVRRSACVAALTCAVVLLPGAAFAEEPERAGWWNRLSAAGTALPAPTTAEGDLRVALGPDGPAAYAALLYPSFGSVAAVLTLTVRPDRTVGTPAVLACATVDTTWTEGANQPWDTAPEYDCALASALGELAPDGSTVTFFLDATQQDLLGSWSLAVVPDPEAKDPFTVDFAKPEADAFVASPPEGSSGSFEPEPFDSGTAEDSGSTGSDGGSGDAFLPGDFELPPAADSGSAEVPPLVAGGAEAALPEPRQPEPALAQNPAAQIISARPAGIADDVGSGRRLLALLVLVGGSAAVGYAAGQQRPGPRLIGGRARLGTPALAAAPGGGAAPAGEERPRGIGRFAKTRDGAPRRLR